MFYFKGFSFITLMLEYSNNNIFKVSGDTVVECQ